MPEYFGTLDPNVLTQTPDSFRVLNHTQAVEAGAISENGLINDLVSALGERAQLPIMETSLFLETDGFLYSKDFPGKKLSDMYGQYTGQEIYDLRSPFDVEYINQIEKWANENSTIPLSWMRISPTTGVMSKETKVEFGYMEGIELKVFILTVPFRENQNINEVFEEIKRLGSYFIPNIKNAKNELDILKTPIRLSPKALSKTNPQLFFDLFNGDETQKFDPAKLINLIDKKLTTATGIEYFRGRPLEKYDAQKILALQQAIKYIANSGLIDLYIQSCRSGDIQLATQNLFNIINNFDRLTEINPDILLTNLFGKDFVNLDLIVENTATPKASAAGCGTMGSSEENKISHDTLKFMLSANIKILRGMGIFVSDKLPDITVCGVCHAVLPVKNGDVKTYWSICPFCRHSEGLVC